MDDTITLINTDVERDSLQYRVASLTILSTYWDAKALNKNQIKHFDIKTRTRLGQAKDLSNQWKDLKNFLESPIFEGMCRTLGIDASKQRERCYAISRGLVDG